MKKQVSLISGLGPGIVVAATGLGAGDVITAAVAGARYGTLILWAALLGALVKWSLNEGLARWQLVTGTTLLEGWVQTMPKWVAHYFLAYLILWSFIVAGALSAACGLAGHALVPGLPVWVSGVLHAGSAWLLVSLGRYAQLERIMKLLVALMFAVVVFCALRVAPEAGALGRGLLVPAVPAGSATWLLGVIGGVGGTVTILSYGYWIREKGWRGSDDLPRVKLDLAVAYLLTGIFGVAIMVVSAGVDVAAISGSGMALAVAEALGETLGQVGKWAFLIGFWAAVFSSMLGVWQGVPYLFADYMDLRRGGDGSAVSTRSRDYRLFLAWMAGPPLLLLFLERPVWIVKLYAVAGAFFMPFLASLLLIMNNRAGAMGIHRNGAVRNLLLVLSLVIFAVLLVVEIHNRVFGG